MPYDNVKSNSILDWTFGKTKLSEISRVYIGLSTNDPVAGKGVFNELSGNGYARVLIGMYGESYPGLITAAAERTILNGRQINWTKATADWPAANGIGLFSSETGGTPYFYGKLEEPVTCPAGAVFLFDPQTLRVSFPDSDVAAE
jgi:hypothetical protein